jgi:hypothetical protein
VAGWIHPPLADVVILNEAKNLFSVILAQAGIHV